MTNVNSLKRKPRKKTNRVTLTLTFIFIIAFLFLMMSLGNINSYGDGEVEYISITVQAGESLWSISEEMTPGHRDLRETMYQIVQHNNLDNEIIHPGQILEVPRIY